MLIPVKPHLILLLLLLIQGCGKPSNSREVPGVQASKASKNSEQQQNPGADGAAIIPVEAVDVMTLVDIANPYGVSPFYIDAYEAALIEHAAVSYRGETPKTDMTIQQAASACSRKGKRLCSILEWTLACRGPKNFSFGFQSAADSPNDIPTFCSVGGKLNQAGANKHCLTDGLEVYDAIGNVSEFVVDVTPGQSLAPFEETIGGRGVVVGGNHSLDTSKNSCAHIVTAAGSVQKDFQDQLVGFRCCKDVAVKDL